MAAVNGTARAKSLLADSFFFPAISCYRNCRKGQSFYMRKRFINY